MSIAEIDRTDEDLAAGMAAIGRAARAAAHVLSTVPPAPKTRALEAAAAAVRANRAAILAANARDLADAEGRGLAGALVDRLLLDDRRVAAIADGLVGYLDELQDRDHEARRSFDAAVDRLAEDLRYAPALRERMDALRDRLPDAPQVRDYLDRVWREARTALERDLARPHLR